MNDPPLACLPAWLFRLFSSASGGPALVAGCLMISAACQRGIGGRVVIWIRDAPAPLHICLELFTRGVLSQAHITLPR